MTNEREGRIVFMAEGGPSMDNESRNFSKPEANADRSELRFQQESEGKQETSRNRGGKLMRTVMAPIRARSESGARKTLERGGLGEAVEHAERGDTGQALDAIKERFLSSGDQDPNVRQEEEKKLNALNTFFKETSKAKDETDRAAVVDALRTAGSNKLVEKVLEGHLSRVGYSKEEQQSLFEEAKQPKLDSEEIANQTDTGGDSRGEKNRPVADKDDGGLEPAPAGDGQEGLREAPTEGGEGEDQLTDEERREIGAVPTEMNKLLTDGKLEDAKKLAAEAGKFLLKGVGKTIKYAIYAAIAAYIIYIGLMAKTGDAIGKK